MSNKPARFKLVFFSPTENTRPILDHLFQKYPNELGKIGEYDQCAFICPGTGESGELEFVKEDRVELVVHDNGEKEELRKAIAELKKVHPYEEVAYDVYRVEDV